MPQNAGLLSTRPWKKNMKKVFAGVLLTTLAAALLLLSWMHTPHGWLTVPAALIGKMATAQEALSSAASIADTLPAGALRRVW